MTKEFVRRNKVLHIRNWEKHLRIKDTSFKQISLRKARNFRFKKWGNQDNRATLKYSYGKEYRIKYYQDVKGVNTFFLNGWVVYEIYYIISSNNNNNTDNDRNNNKNNNSS